MLISTKIITYVTTFTPTPPPPLSQEKVQGVRQTRSWSRHAATIPGLEAELPRDLFAKLTPLTPATPPVPLQSTLLHCSTLQVGSDMLHELQVEAAALVMERLVQRPKSLCVIAPMANRPRAEIFFNAKLSVQFSRATAGARYSTPQPQWALCPACISCNNLDSEQHRQCSSCGPGAGCSKCVGKQLSCPSCQRTFAREWTYETGSGRGSIGRDITR